MKFLNQKEILAILVIVSLSLNVFLGIKAFERKKVNEMLLAEQERILTSEQNLLVNNSVYATSSLTLATIHDYGNIVVPAGGGIVYFAVYAELLAVTAPGPSHYADFLLQIASKTAGGKHLTVTGGAVYTTATKYDIFGGAVWLDSGTYNITVKGLVDNAACSAIVYGISVGITSFNDLQVSTFQHYTAASTNITLTVAARNTPLGPLNQAVYALTISCDHAWGSGLTVQIDGVTKTTPDEDAGTTATGIYVYKLFTPLTVGSSHTITIALSAAAADASVLACPWILTTAEGASTHKHWGHSPITLDLPQLATAYINVGSLFIDGIKNCYVGKMKGVSFGQSDYYASGAVATGMLTFSYTFSSLSVPFASLVVDSGVVLGGCIENIGVDI